MADDDNLFRLYLNERYVSKYNQISVENRRDNFKDNNLFRNQNKLTASFIYYPEYNTFDGIANICNKKYSSQKKRRYKVYKHTDAAHILTASLRHKHSNDVYKKYSLPALKQSNNINGWNLMKRIPYVNKYVVNVISQYNVSFGNFDPFRNPTLQAGLKIYRCQLSTKEESCCCSCNSDAMFEVMKSLYDCYKKKNCDHCNCILCGHLPKEERRVGEIRKSVAVMKIASDIEKANVITAVVAEMDGKSPTEKEKILRDLAIKGVPLPKGRTPSENELLKRVKTAVGLPPEPKTAYEKEKYKIAKAEGIITPLEGKPTSEKEKILKRQAELGLQLPEGRTASEKVMIKKVKTGVGIQSKIPSEKLRKAKAAGLLTPLQGKSPKQKETIIRRLAQYGVPLPEPKTASEKKLSDKIRKDLGLPPEPTTAQEKDKYNKALTNGFITPLNGKTTIQKENILKSQIKMGISLPEGRTPSEKALIDKIKVTTKRLPSALLDVSTHKLKKAKAAGLLTPIEGKSSEQKEIILRGLAQYGIPLPELKTASERKILTKIRKEFSTLPEPKTAAENAKYNKTWAKSLITPLRGKTTTEKEKILKKLAEMGISLPEGRTQSERALIDKINASTKKLPPAILNVSSDKLKKATVAGLKTPIQGKTPAQKEQIFKELAQHGIPLSEPNTKSEKILFDKIRVKLGLPPNPETTAEKEVYNKAMAKGLLTPLEGKTSAQKAKILQRQADFGIRLPEGRTSSEKILIAKIKASTKASSHLIIPIPSANLRKAKAAGLLTPLTGKTPYHKEKILRGLAAHRMPLPEGKTSSERKLIDKVRQDIGLPPEPKTKSDKEKYKRALTAGLITPLKGKTSAQKNKILQGLVDLDLPLPEGRTPSEKIMIINVKADKTPSLSPAQRKKLDYKTARIMKDEKGPSDECICTQLTPETTRVSKLARISKEPGKITSEKGLFTPLKGKTSEQKENILRRLAKHGIPLPEPTSASDRKLINKVVIDLGLPPKPKTTPEKEKYNKALAAGFVTPLEGKTSAQKEKIIQGQADLGLHLPEGRTPSEKAIIAKIKAVEKEPSVMQIPVEKWLKAKAAGLITPLEGKTSKQKEQIFRGLAQLGIPLPEPKTGSEIKLMAKVRKELGIPPKPRTTVEKAKYKKAVAKGLITPLEGKTFAQKERILRNQVQIGIPLPEGRTVSEKALIHNIKATTKRLPSVILTTPSEKIRRAKAAGLITPLEGKSPEQKQKLLRRLAQYGMPMPEPKTTSERQLMDKVRKEIGIPPEPKTSTAKVKYNNALAAGLITPLEGKTTAQKKKILTDQADLGLGFPEGRTISEKALIAKVKAAAKPLYVVPIPSENIAKAKAAGLITPLTGKTTKEKEKILKGLAEFGLPMPAPTSVSEKRLFDKVRAATKITQFEKLRQTKGTGLLTPLEGKTLEQKKNILRKLIKAGVPLPEPKTSSEKELIRKLRNEVGLPTEPITPSINAKYPKLQAAGIITPLGGDEARELDLKTAKVMKDSKGPSDECICPLLVQESVKESVKIEPSETFSEKLRKANAAGLITPLEGKTSIQKQKILYGLAERGIPLPESKTVSEKKSIDKIRKSLGLPSEPKTAEEKEKHLKAAAAGLLIPLEGKTSTQKEKILQGQAALGIPLPEGRTPSEKAMIANIKASKMAPSVARIPSEKLRKAKAAGLLTPLEGKPSKQKEIILRGLAQHGIPIPESKTASQEKLTEKVKKDLGLPPEPKTKAEKLKYNKAFAKGYITPLEGKTSTQKEKILKDLAKMGIPLPEGRTQIEKALIDKIKATIKKLPSAKIKPSETFSEKLQKANAAGLLTPLQGKTSVQKQKIIYGLAERGIPMPESKTVSEKKLIEKIRKRLGLPPEPKTATEKEKHLKAAAAGLLTPLEGKTSTQKEKILQGQAELGIRLPKGRTPTEKALIDKIKELARAPSAVRIPSEKLRKAKAAGLLTPLEGKFPEQKEKILRGLAQHGIPMPEAKTASQKKLIEKVKKDLGLPPEPKTKAEKAKYDKAFAKGIVTPLEGKTLTQKEKILRTQAEMGIPLPESRTLSEKGLIDKIKTTVKKISSVKLKPSETFSEKLQKANAAGLLTPLDGKTSEQKEKILHDLAEYGIPLPEPKTPSEMKLIDKIRKSLGLPPEPRTAAEKEKHLKAAAAGLLTPLEGKTSTQKEKILQGQAELGIRLPEGRTPSEKALIDKIKELVRAPSAVGIPSEKLRKAKAAGLLTPLEGKFPEQKEKILRGLAQHGIPMPEAKTASQKKLIEKVKKDLGLPPEPKNKAEKAKYDKAFAKGIVTPLEGKTLNQKEKILRTQAEMGIPLPESRTLSEKGLIDKIKTTVKKISSVKLKPSETFSEKLQKANAAGLLTPLDGKTSEQKEKILHDLAEYGIPLPEPKTPSEMKLIDKIRKSLGLPPEPRTAAEKEKHLKAAAAGLLTPLEGKTSTQKEKILQGQAELGIRLPEGRTPSEKALIDKIKELVRAPSAVRIPSEKLRKAKAAGLLTPLEGKFPEQKEKILRGLAQRGIPMPEAKTASQKKLIEKVKKDLGLPPEPKNKAEKAKYDKAFAKGIVTPLEGKTLNQKEKILRTQAEMGIPLPESRTLSEKGLIDIIKSTVKKISSVKLKPSETFSEKLQKANAAGLLTPLEGKPSEQKEKILHNLAEYGIPLPEPKTPSEMKLIDKIRKSLGLPPEPRTTAEKEKHLKAAAAGLLTPLEGKTSTQKEKILQGQAELGIRLPEGRTPSEKALIDKIKELVRAPSAVRIPSEKLRKAKAAGLLTPLEGKFPDHKEKLLRGLAQHGIPMPEAKTASQKKLIEKVKKDLGLPPEPKTKAEKAKYEKAFAKGIVTPLEGKTLTQKEKILRSQAEMGIPLPDGRTQSEKALIDKIKVTTKKIPSAEGLLTPLAEKSPEEKEKIIKGLADAGLSLPEGKTPSEKELVRKVRTAVGLPPKITPSEKFGKIRTKSKQIGLMPSKKSTKAISISGQITQEFEDVVRTTTCDRGCGCDKKKIRFKHSYVKIRVTSPDFSSVCACPEECIPGVKRGIFADNEGIKVTISSAIGVPSYYPESNLKQKDIACNKTLKSVYLNNRMVNIKTAFQNIDTEEPNMTNCDYVYFDSANTRNDCTYAYSTSDSKESLPYSHVYIESNRLCPYINDCDSQSYFDDVDAANHDTWHKYTSTCFSIDSYAAPINSQTLRENSSLAMSSTTTSFESILNVKTPSSLSLISNSLFNGGATISVISLMNSNFSSNSSHFLVSEHSADIKSIVHSSDFNDDMKFYTNKYSTNASQSYKSEIYGFYSCCMEHYQAKMHNKYLNRYITKSALSESSFRKKEELNFKDSSIVIISNINRDEDIIKAMNKIVDGKHVENGSSIYIVVTCSDNEPDCIIDSHSTICLQLSNMSHEYSSNVVSVNVNTESKTQNSPYGLKFKFGRKDRRFDMKTPKMKEAPKKHEIDILPKYINCQTKEESHNKSGRKLFTAGPANYNVAMDTTEDRPCCCCLEKVDTVINKNDISCFDNALSDLIIPMRTEENEEQGFSKGIIKKTTSKYAISSKSVVLMMPPNIKPVPVKACSIPPCMNVRKPNRTHTISQSTTCIPEDFVGSIDKDMVNMQGMKCAGKENVNCGQCSHIKMYGGRTIRCQCGTTEKKVKLKCPCPCGIYTKEIPSQGAAACGGCDELAGQLKGANTTEKPCQCDEKKSEKKERKNIICQCPQLSELTQEQQYEHLNDFEWVDVKEIRKMKSDLTQTMSGFTMDVIPRPPLQEDMSFEEALEYYGDQQPPVSRNDADCSCDAPVSARPPPIKLPSGVDCLCPNEERPEDNNGLGQFEQEQTGQFPLKGIRLTIDGKGSRSTGLGGICCFDMTQETYSPHLIRDKAPKYSEKI